MGRIALVVGPHGVGKSTLFKFAKSKGEFIVFEGIEIPKDGYNLHIKEDFLAYETLYTESINKNNRLIQNSDHDGLVVRSIEESSYYFNFYHDANVMSDYRKIFENETNIKADFLIFLDADFDTLQARCRNDRFRDMQETALWYKNEYERYIDYWKNYPGIVSIDTIGRTTESIYEEIKNVFQRI